MGESFESLEIEISAQANNANAALDGLVKRLQKVSTALLGANGAGLSNLANGVSQLSASMQTMSGVKSTDFNRIAKGISKFGSINSSAIHSASNALVHLVTSLNGIGAVNFDAVSLTNLASAISKLGGVKAGQATSNLPQIKKDLIGFIQGLNGLKTINFDMTGLSSLVGSISKLGGKAATNAIPNIQNLGIALKGMMQTLAKAPKVNQNLIQMANAMAALASNGSKVSSATKGVANGLRTYQYAADRAHKSSKNLASSIGMLYAKFWVFMRAFRGLWKSIESSMDYLETVNYFDSAMGQIADNAEETWKQAGFDSAEAYADSFGRRAKELTKKMTGFSIGDDGSLTATNAPNLGLNPEKLLNYQATYAQMASSMGVASGTAMKLSNALTMIGADLASVKNLEFESVWENMASGMVGMSRAVDKYGINLRNANMQEELYRLGLDMKISKLNQADKAVLRTIMILNASKYAWGDLATTLGSPANQLRMLQAGFTNLARTIGGLLLPIVAKVLPYINALVVAIQRLFSWIGGLLGIKIGSLNTSIGGAAVDMGDFADSAEDAAGGLGDAADNAKKLNKQLAGWHELENMTSKEDSSGGSGAGGGAGGGGLLDDALNDALADYYAAWDAAFAGMENTVNDMADKVCAAFKRIWDTAEPTREALKRLWNEGLSELGNFTWTALKDFWDYFLVPLGNWTLGEGLPRFINITNDFLTSINWSEINDALRNFWQALEPFAENVGRGLIKFYEDLTSVLSPVINTLLPPAIELLAKIIKLLTPFADELGYLIGASIAINTFATSLGVLKGIGKIALKITGISSIAKAFGTMKGIAIPVATALTTKVIPAFTAMFKALGGSKAASSALTFMFPKISAFVANVGSLFTSLPGIISGGVAAIGSGLGSIGSIFGLAGGVAVAAGAAVVAAIAAVVAGIIYTVTHWDEVKEFWTVTVPGWWNESVIPFFEEIPDKLAAIWELVKTTASEKWDGFLTYMGGIPERIGGVITAVWNWFNQLPGQIGYALGYALGTVTQWGLDLYAYLSEKIPEIIGNVVTWFTELPGKIYTAISGAISKVVAWGTEVFDTFKTKVGEIVTNVVNWFGELPGKIYDEIIKIKNNISTWATNTIDFFRTEVPKIVDKVVEFFEKLPERIVDTGENLVKGLWKGISNFTDWLGTKIGEFCEGVVNGFKAGFDEHSPSKKAFKIGDYFTLGLQNGILDRFGDIMSDINSFGSQLSGMQFSIPTIEYDFDISRNIMDTVSLQYGMNSLDVMGDLDSSFSANISELLYETRRQNELLQTIADKPVINKDDIGEAYKSYASDFRKRTGKQLGFSY